MTLKQWQAICTHPYSGWRVGRIFLCAGNKDWCVWETQERGYVCIDSDKPNNIGYVWPSSIVIDNGLEAHPLLLEVMESL